MQLMLADSLAVDKQALLALIWVVGIYSNN